LGVFWDDLDHCAIFDFCSVRAGEFPDDFFDHHKTASWAEATPPVIRLTVSALVSTIHTFPSGASNEINTIQTTCSAPEKRCAFEESVSIKFFRTRALLGPKLKP
jgi:hypothetical protein